MLLYVYCSDTEICIVDVVVLEEPLCLYVAICTYCIAKNYGESVDSMRKILVI